MNIHEFQAKALLKKYNIPIPAGKVATSGLKARMAAVELGLSTCLIKAQVHAGARGKGGGIRMASTVAETESIANEMLGCRLVTPQTGSEGKPVNSVLVEEGLNITGELYLSIMPDRRNAEFVIIASRAGGMDIEAVAAERPDDIHSVSVSAVTGLRSFHCRDLAMGLQLPPSLAKAFGNVVNGIFRLCRDHDASLVEINPLAIIDDERIVALDAKVNIDDNALFRQPSIREMRDPHQEDPLEVEAQKHDLSYIKLDGNIGNMVNGAGLAMATMDLIQQVGAAPANFLDVGGGASAEKVASGLKIILSDPNVKAILINIFGGILRCDVLAEGVVCAAKATGVSIPVVVRLEGTRAEEGRKILSGSGMKIIPAADLAEAAAKVAQLTD